jgi:hypothetical protein
MIPLILGVVVALVGLAILADAWLPEEMTYRSERRRQQRTERSVSGEAFIGLAVLCMAAVLIGRDTWRYGTVVIIAGALFFLIGAVLNRHYLRDRIVNRGALRRGEPRKPAPPKAGNRIR